MNRATTERRPPNLVQLAVGPTVALLERSGYLKLRFQTQRGLRIICYHGICADEVASEPWVPDYFVSVGSFAEQLTAMKRFGPVVHLPEVLEQLISGAWNLGVCFAVTFDDVAACTFKHAGGILAEHGVRASFFVSSGHTTTGRLFDADVINLLRGHRSFAPGAEQGTLGRLLCRPADHKRMTLEQLRSALHDAERALRQNIDPAILEVLRPMNWDEVRQLAAQGHDVGGHTVDHAILGPQSPETRRLQITECVSAIERQVGHRPIGFAYPNGGPGDFDPADYETLKACGVRYAASTRAGFAGRGEDVYALPRVCLGLAHTPQKFALEVSGLLDQRRLRQQGWV